MRCSLSSVALSLALLSSAEPLLSPYNVHEKRTHIPSGWSLTRRHDPTSSIPLRFALKQRNIEGVGNHLYDVSHPKSPNYGKHWTAADIVRTFAPSDETVDIVRSWLIASGIDGERVALGRTKGWIQVNVTVEEAEQLMNTEYNMYTHMSGKEHVACEVYYLPQHVQPHVDFVTPSVHFDAKLTRRSGGESVAPARDIQRVGFGTGPKTGGTVSGVIDGLEQCNMYITPTCLRTLYDLFYNPVATDKNSFGIDYAQTTHEDFAYHKESNLDLQYGMSLVTGNQTVSLYQTGDLPEEMAGQVLRSIISSTQSTAATVPPVAVTIPETLFIQIPDLAVTQKPKGPEACGTVKPAYVISTSYSSNEADLSLFYVERQCTEYAKLGLMGITILYSSGDYGVAGNHGSCLNSSHIPNADGYIFNPTFPGTCPYVTSVGATMVRRNETVLDPETACMNQIYSGGGFSNYFALPEYQKNAVHHYLTNYPPDYPSSIWNSTGTSRAYPDISANGANYVVAVDGEFQRLYGTSCSSPVVGAIFTMINDARLALGKGPIGFVNPTIYSPEFADAFNDITEGNNPGCGTTGYNVTRGWDPVTGLGTLNFTKLLALWS
ncbi:peptidase S8/S53 domain-containing protein [Boletus edulis]|nr:peptidase S8/S53 domain-containing protein [Boletus edulis]